MIAAILSPSHTMPQLKDPAMSQNSNAAGAPLPLIPRRINSTLQGNTICNSGLQIHRANKPLSIVQSNGAQDYVKRSQSVETPRSEQLPPARVPADPCQPVQEIRGDTIHHTTCVSLPLITTSGSSPQFQSCGQMMQHVSEGLMPSKAPSPDSTNRTGQSRLVRKKSGQLVKPSLKSSSCLNERLSVVTLGTTSKSEPPTPMLAKAVHFDAQLEHVKLFLAQQKPIAVSRDGSPVDDTSGTDSDFPSFIYGCSNDKKSGRMLNLELVNMPLSLDKFADVILETLSLTPEGTSIIGRVRLRNIAYVKVLVVRFTFDDWLTTNDVNGRYLEAIDAEFDRFTFFIKLQDILPRIEGIKLIFALRYAVDGREVWDNNMGQNYIATFSHSTRTGGIALEGEQEFAGIPDPQSKLEAPHPPRKEDLGQNLWSLHNRYQGKGYFADHASVAGKSASSSSEYDFGSILGSSWSPLKKSATNDDNAQLHNSSMAPRLCLVMEDSVPSLVAIPPGSPRDRDGDTFHPTTCVRTDVDETPFHIAPYSPPFLNHKRNSFGIRCEDPDARETTPATAMLDDTKPIEEARPSYSSGDGGPSVSSCLSHILALDLSPRPENTDMKSGGSTSQLTASLSSESGNNVTINHGRSHSSYREFLETYCFFTGSGFSSASGVAGDVLFRTGSTVDIKDNLSGTLTRLRQLGCLESLVTTDDTGLQSLPLGLVPLDLPWIC